MAPHSEATSLVEAHTYLVRGTRARWFPGLSGALAEEVEGAGRQALAEAAREFESGQGASFATFAVWRLRDAMRAECRRQDRWQRFEEPFEAPHEEEETDSATASIPDDSPGPLERAFGSEARLLLLAAVHGLPWVEREVIWRHYWHREALVEIGDTLGCGVRRARRLHEDALGQLRGMLWSARELFGVE
jgi:RNA polymerase sigma factor (sigma-70 family)